MSLEELKATSDVKPVENEIIVDDAEVLEKFKDGSLDFIIANHVFEHCRNPILTLQTWLRRLKHTGIIYAAIPEKTKTFDKNRPVTTLAHIISDYAAGPAYSDLDHYREYLANVDGLNGTELEERAQLCLRTMANIHFHAWDLAAQKQMMEHLEGKLGFQILECADNGAEIIWVLRKL